MTGKKSLLSNYRDEFQGTVRFGNDLFAPIVGRGDIVQEKLIIKDVSYVEGLGHNLFSIGKFCDKKLNVNFTDTRCSVRTATGKELIAGTRTSDLYTIDLANPRPQQEEDVCLLSKAVAKKAWLWHRRLSHLNFSVINKLVKHNLVDGIPAEKYEKDHLCSACEKGKMKRKTHKPKLVSSTTEPLELLHMDLCGPMGIQSYHQKKYILVIVDDYSRYTWVFFLKSMKLDSSI